MQHTERDYWVNSFFRVTQHVEPLATQSLSSNDPLSLTHTQLRARIISLYPCCYSFSEDVVKGYGDTVMERSISVIKTIIQLKAPLADYYLASIWKYSVKEVLLLVSIHSPFPSLDRGRYTSEVSWPYVIFRACIVHYYNNMSMAEFNFSSNEYHNMIFYMGNWWSCSLSSL